MTQTQRRKWTFDLTPNEAPHVPAPYGYISASVQDTSGPRQHQQMKLKRAAEIAKSPFSMVVLYGLLFFLIPNAPSIYSLSFAFLALFNPIKQAFSVRTAFAGLHDEKNGTAILGYQAMYVALNLFFAGLALWKISKMGLLPTNDADWIAFYGVPQPVDIVLQPEQ